jgi:hypothetical protein
VSEIRSFWRNAMVFEARVAENTALGQQFLRFFRWQNRLKKDLIDKVFAFRRDWAGLDGQWPPVASTCRGSNFSKTDCFHVFLF